MRGWIGLSSVACVAIAAGMVPAPTGGAGNRLVFDICPPTWRCADPSNAYSSEEQCTPVDCACVSQTDVHFQCTKTVVAVLERFNPVQGIDKCAKPAQLVCAWDMDCIEAVEPCASVADCQSLTEGTPILAPGWVQTLTDCAFR